MDHVFKFLVVGTVGFIINTTVLLLGVKKFGLKPSIAGPLGAELAILSNFFWNNVWTFSDKTITSWDVLPGKFLTFNILSFGSVVIQFIFLKVGEMIFGLAKFKEPFINQNFLIQILKTPQLYNLVSKLPMVSKFSLYFIFYMSGVGVGLIWNFTIYNFVIWK